jgi:hypothetical protein
MPRGWLEQAERERTWALFSARAEGISIRTLAAIGRPSRVHQLVAAADLDALDAPLGELRAAGDYVRSPTTGSEQLGPPPSSDTSTPGGEASRQ